MAKKNSGWIKWLVFLMVIGGAITGGIWYFKKDSTAPQYQTATLSRGDLLQAVTATGSLTPVLNVQVGSQISGRIRALYVDFNSTVKSNQVIAEIDPSTYQVAVLRAEAQLSNSVANLNLTRVQAKRAVSLFTSNLIPAADNDIAMAQLQQAEAEVRSSQATLASANVDLSRCSIVAPVDGVVISRNVDVGQTVASSFNTPTLFIIANDLSKMQIGALVSEADIGGVENGQEVNFRVDAYPERPFRGKVSQIRYGAVTNQNVVNYSAIIDVNNDDLKLLPSMTANVSIIIQERENVLKIPNSALRFRPPEALAAKSPTNSPRASVEGAPRGAGRPRGEGRGGEGRGPRGAGGAGGNRTRESAERFSRRTVYVLASQDSAPPVLKPVQIRTGISDGASTEVLEG
ncbi:MAG: efflux RND transporter periplasmic adaptor subunit, partial [Akkermansiaceae bacterium]|nr:efflux RND transporter periplasmic adaptor subunit [Verrucomicrobiales bacterium]